MLYPLKFGVSGCFSAPRHLCLLHNLDTVQDIFDKLDKNQNHNQTMCRAQKPKLHFNFLQNYAPLKFFI